MKIIRINAMWCPACIVMHKAWNKIEEEYKMIEYISYDYDFDEELVKKYQVGKILPVTIFIKDDKELIRLNGEKPYKELKETIEKLVK